MSCTYEFTCIKATYKYHTYIHFDIHPSVYLSNHQCISQTSQVEEEEDFTQPLHPLSPRMSRVSELRKALYKGYEPPEPEDNNKKPPPPDVDLEAARPEDGVEDEMTANFQRKYVVL